MNQYMDCTEITVNPPPPDHLASAPLSRISSRGGSPFWDSSPDHRKSSKLFSSGRRSVSKSIGPEKETAIWYVCVCVSVVVNVCVCVWCSVFCWVKIYTGLQQKKTRMKTKNKIESTHTHTHAQTHTHTYTHTPTPTHR